MIYLDKEQLKRIYDVYDFSDNENIVTAYIKRNIIARAIEEYHNDESESVMFFIDNYLRENGIGYSIIDWNEIEY